MSFNRYTPFSVRRSSTPRSSSPLDGPDQEAWGSWLGLPSFHLSLTLLGILVFTFVSVTFHFNVAAVGVAIGAAGIVLQKEKMRLPAPVWLLGAFVLWAFVGSAGSPYSDVALDQALEHFKLLVILLVAINAFHSEGQLRFYLYFLLGCFILFPVRVALVGYATGGSVIADRLVSYQTYTNSNDFATLSLLALGAALALTFAGSSWTMARLGATVSAFLLFVVILLTQSRGALVGFAAGFGPALVLMGAKRPGRLLFFGGLIALVIGLVVPSSAWERLSGMAKLTSASTVAQADPEGSAAERFEIVKAGLQVVAEYPVFGVGLGTYQRVNAVYAPHIGQRDAHNTYLKLAVEVGIPGLILWLAFIGSLLRYAYRSRRLAAPGVLTTQQVWIERGLVAFLVSAIFGTYSHLSFLYLILAALWCSAALLSRATPIKTVSDGTGRP